MSVKYPAGKFKAECLKLMDQVKRYGQSVTITKHGKPIAKLVPAEDSSTAIISPFGIQSGTGEIHGDIVNPIGEGWDADGK